MRFIVKHEIFGGTPCWMYSVGWQKRGLPHAHILAWLVGKIMPDQIGSIISAKIPDITTDPELFEIKTLHSRSSCMERGRCLEGYPRNLHVDTITGKDGYPLCRERSAEDGGPGGLGDASGAVDAVQGYH